MVQYKYMRRPDLRPGIVCAFSRVLSEAGCDNLEIGHLGLLQCCGSYEWDVIQEHGVIVLLCLYFYGSVVVVFNNKLQHVDDALLGMYTTEFKGK